MLGSCKQPLLFYVKQLNQLVLLEMGYMDNPEENKKNP